MKKRKQSMPTFHVPKSVYDQAFDEIHQLSEKKIGYNTVISNRCHQSCYKNFNTCEPALNSANILEAARQAFADRNFRVLYEIIDKGMDLKENVIAEQLFEYLFAAIEIDPKIVNREEMLTNAVKGYKLLENDVDAMEIVKKAHILTQHINKVDSNESDSD